MMWRNSVYFVGVFISGIALGQTIQTHFSGTARVYHMVDEGTTLNHGQPLVEVEFNGRFKEPEKGSDWIVNPHWREGSGGEIYFDSFSVEQGEGPR